MPHSSPAGSQAVLIAADPAAGLLHSLALPVPDATVAAIPSAPAPSAAPGTGTAMATLVGTLEDHAGFLDFGAGLVAFVDAATSELVVIDTTAGPAVLDRHPVAQPAKHVARDRSGRWVVVTTDAGSALSSTSDALTVLDRVAGRHAVLRTHVGAAGVVVHGDPPRLLLRHHSPAMAESYPLEPLLDLPAHSRLPEPEAVLPIGELGHGEALLCETGLVALATAAGVHLLEVDGAGSVPRLRGTMGWGPTGGRGFYLRLAPDCRHLVSSLRVAPSLSDPGWQDWENEAWVLDVANLRTWRLGLGPGLVFRCAAGVGAAAYTRMHPDGDEVVLVDLIRREITARIPLPQLADPPRPGHSPWEGAERRSTAMSPDGAWVAVSHGGDGLVSLIETTVGGIVDTWAVGTPLHEGGYLTVVDPAAPAVDTVNR